MKSKQYGESNWIYQIYIYIIFVYVLFYVHAHTNKHSHARTSHDGAKTITRRFTTLSNLVSLCMSRYTNKSLH